MSALGQHFLVDFYGCVPERIASVAVLRDPFLAALRRSGATILSDHFHQFEPQGVSAVVLLAESHASFHSWPERGCVTLDLFTCSPRLAWRDWLEELKQGWGAQTYRLTELWRGEASP